MNEASDGGLSATDEHTQETPPAKEDHGQEHEAGAAPKDDSEQPPTSGDAAADKEEVPKGVQKRIQRAVRDRDVAYGRAAQAEQENERLRQQLAGVQRGEKPDDPQAKRPEPKQDASAQERQTRLQDFMDDGEDKYDDFVEVVQDNPRLRVTPAMADAMMDADNGVDIAYHLAKNTKEARRIAGLGEIAQAKEIGKLEAQLAAAKPKPKPVSKAPAPIEPVAGRSRASGALRADDPMEDFVRAEARHRRGL